MKKMICVEGRQGDDDMIVLTERYSTVELRAEGSAAERASSLLSIAHLPCRQ